jgi:hypothetical protein
VKFRVIGTLSEIRKFTITILIRAILGEATFANT